MKMDQNGSSRVGLLAAAAGLIAAAVVYLVVSSNSGSSTGAPGPRASSSTGDPQASSPGDDSDLHPQTEAERAAALAHQPAVVQPISRPAAGSPVPVAAAAPRVEASPATRQLVSALTNLDFSRGSITPEAANQWKQSLQDLVGHGATAVPAIRDFLEQNKDFNFASIGGGDQLGQSSLRAAFLGALGQIGGPEATGLMISTLQSTTMPGEIAQIAQYLEQQAPGQYRQEVFNAANDILGMAGKGQLPGVDVGALFKVFQNYGDASAAGMLDQLQGPYRYYATMALANLPNSEGVATLVQGLQDPSGAGRRDFSLEMLAQMAGDSPDAANALLQQAKTGQLSDATWRKIITGLTGDQYQIGAPPTDPGQTLATMPGLKTYHIESGNQNFYSLPLGPDATTQSRLNLIDQLLATGPSQATVQALQAARAQLAAFGPPPAK
jgi:hypothetical protein